MKKRTMKSLLAIMALVCLLLTSFTVTAAAAVSNSSEISPLYTGISRLTAGLDINDDGNLIVRNENNIIQEIISGEVSIRGVKGYV